MGGARHTQAWHQAAAGPLTHVIAGITSCMLQSMITSSICRRGAKWLCMMRVCRRNASAGQGTVQDRAW